MSFPPHDHLSTIYLDLFELGLAFGLVHVRVVETAWSVARLDRLQRFGMVSVEEMTDGTWATRTRLGSVAVEKYLSDVAESART